MLASTKPKGIEEFAIEDFRVFHKLLMDYTCKKFTGNYLFY